MTLDDLIMSIEIEREQAVKRRERAQSAAKMILERATQEGRANLTADEDADIKAESEKRDRANTDISGIDAKLERAKEARDAERAIEDAQKERKADATPARRSYDGVARVGREERTYTKDKDRRGGAFVRDVTRQFLYNDLAASERLHRHMQEERVERGEQLEMRAVGTGAFAGLVVPQYLTDMYAPATAAMRPFADACNQHDLPDNGMTVNISRITTPTGIGLQTSENTAVLATPEIDDTLLTENVQTAAGQQTLSRQAIDRGTGVESIVLDDLYRRYATNLDATLINQAATGLTNIANSNAFVQASPTAAQLYPKILGAASSAEASLLGQATPDIAIMHSRRWYWLNASLTTSWPLLAQPGIPEQQGGVNYATRYGAGFRGILPNGLAVIVDNNIGTTLGAGTEDEIYVVSTQECHLWEDPAAPVFIRAEQAAAANLGVLLVLYGYFAYSFRRYPQAVQKINGTGLIAPTF